MSWFFQPIVPAAADLLSTPATQGYVKVWNGSTWLIKPVKYWNGSEWVIKPVKYWNGTTWNITSGV